MMKDLSDRDWVSMLPFGTKRLQWSKQKNKSNRTMEALAFRARTLLLQGQFGRAPKILSSEGIAPDNRKTLIELEKLHSRENQILEPIKDYSCEAFQFDEAEVHEASWLQFFVVLH